MDLESLRKAIEDAEGLLARLDRERQDASDRLLSLREQYRTAVPPAPPSAERQSLLEKTPATAEEKVALFRSLFRGREDVYPKYWRNERTGKSGYSPACAKEWVRGVCEKPRIKCGECPNRSFLPVTDQVVFDHLQGRHVIGIYPLLPDETCRFLAVDFDKQSWKDDTSAFLETCRKTGIPAYPERSRSGNGAHIWFVFESAIAAAVARKMGCFLITETMDCRHQLAMESYDRLFPNQDTMPTGGFGNLIALPLQNGPRKDGNTVFLDERFNVHPDQWAFLASIRKISPGEVQAIADEAMRKGQVIGVPMSVTDDVDSAAPWLRTPSRKLPRLVIDGPLPREVRGVLAQLPAVSFERVLGEVRARYVTGLTATPYRRDGHQPIIHMQCGPIQFAVPTKRHDSANSWTHRLVVRDTGFDPGRLGGEAGIQDVYACLAADEKRNQMIFDDVMLALEEGRSPILLTERKDHLDLLAAKMRRFARHIVVLKGGMKNRERRETMERLAAIPDGEERLVLATGRYIGEGFDDARLDTLFLALPVSWKGTLVQYAGRLHRLHPGKREVRIYDYVDRHIPMLARMFERRLCGYRAIGYSED